jgi:hypothetical protein
VKIASCIFEYRKARTWIVALAKPEKAVSEYLSGKPQPPAEFAKFVGS